MTNTSLPICGHKRQIAYLARACKRGMPFHAVMFSGPEGVGKKTVALNFIAGLFCGETERDNHRSFGCGSCRKCLEIIEGRHPDIHVIAGRTGKEISIGEIREARRRAALHPYYGSWRGVLIDEAHTMTPEAQSALLKILEEPPPKTLFFLITSLPHLLFDTIRSRASEITFGCVEERDIERWIDDNFPEAENGDLVLTLAEGRPGRAKTLLEKKEFLKEEKTKLSRFESILAKDLADQFLFSEAVSTEADEGKAFLHFCVKKSRSALLADEHSLRACVAKIKNLLELCSLFETTNMNTRLLIDSAVLEMRNGV